MKDNTRDYFKKHFGGVYGTMRSVRNSLRLEKKKREAEKHDDITHDAPITMSAPIAKIYVNDEINRLNIILDKFSVESIENKDVSQMLTFATKIAREKSYALRIIVRNNLPNPKLYTDFLSEHKLKAPENYSFYTDYSGRLASPVHRLEVARGDVFFVMDEYENLERWANGK